MSVVVCMHRAVELFNQAANALNYSAVALTVGTYMNMGDRTVDGIAMTAHFYQRGSGVALLEQWARIIA